MKSHAYMKADRAAMPAHRHATDNLTAGHAITLADNDLQRFETHEHVTADVKSQDRPIDDNAGEAHDGIRRRTHVGARTDRDVDAPMTSRVRGRGCRETPGNEDGRCDRPGPLHALRRIRHYRRRAG